MSQFSAGELCLGHYGAEISNFFMSNKTKSFSPEGFETVLFQNGCLAFRSSANIVLFLKLKISMTSSSLQVQPGDL
jgi:hypothetical protein